VAGEIAPPPTKQPLHTHPARHSSVYLATGSLTMSASHGLAPTRRSSRESKFRIGAKEARLFEKAGLLNREGVFRRAPRTQTTAVGWLLATTLHRRRKHAQTHTPTARPAQLWSAFRDALAIRWAFPSAREIPVPLTRRARCSPENHEWTRLNDYRLEAGRFRKEVVSYGLKSCAHDKRKHATVLKRLPNEKEESPVE